MAKLWGQMMTRGWSRRLAAKYLGVDPEISHDRLYRLHFESDVVEAIEPLIRDDLEAVIAKRAAIEAEQRERDERSALMAKVVSRVYGYRDPSRRAKLLRTYCEKYDLSAGEREAVECRVDELVADRERREGDARKRAAELALCVTRIDLQGRGWPKQHIRRCLLDPDASESFLVCGKGLWTRYYYRRERVEAIERSAEFESKRILNSGKEA